MAGGKQINQPKWKCAEQANSAAAVAVVLSGRRPWRIRQPQHVPAENRRPHNYKLTPSKRTPPPSPKLRSVLRGDPAAAGEHSWLKPDEIGRHFGAAVEWCQ